MDAEVRANSDAYVPINKPLRDILSPLLDSGEINYYEKGGKHYLKGSDLVDLFSKFKQT